MSKEQQELIDEAYKNFKEQIEYGLNSMFLVNDGPNKITPLTQEEFINTCKTYPELKWGLKIEERKLSLFERYGLVRENGLCPKYSFEIENGKPTPNKMSESEWYDNHNIPTKLITITYNDKTIISYE
jgi:hypothetical protein